MGAALLLWIGLLAAAPASEPAPVVARVEIGAGDATGQRMFGRALHRRRILRGEPAVPPAERFDPQRWLRARRPALRDAR